MFKYSTPFNVSWIPIFFLLVAVIPSSFPLLAQTGSGNPYALDINEISPDFIEQNKIIRDLLIRGRAQFLHGDYAGATETFKEVEARDANNAEAKLFSQRIAEMIGAIHKRNVYKTREQMLSEVDQQWERPKVFDVADESVNDPIENEVQRKLKEIVIPQVNFSGIELARVVETLSELSREYDDNGIGVNIVPLFDSNENNPRVNITLRNLSLGRILQFVTQQVNFNYEVGIDAVTVTRSFGPVGGQSTVTEFFPISKGTVIRLTGFGDDLSDSGDSADPFGPSSSSAAGSSSGKKADALQAFFQRAGIDFNIPGAGLAFDEEQLIVTQTRQNLDRMRAILRNYSEVNQVEIEAKFLEVAQTDLEEFGFEWTLTKGGATVAQFNPRNVSQAFGGVSADISGITIETASRPERLIPTKPPSVPQAGDLGIGVKNVFPEKNIFEQDGYNLDLAIRALSRKAGSDLMSAPKVTVLSGKRASITIAQEIRYPEDYDEIRSEVSSGGNNSSGGEGVTITAGTPQNFTTREVGVKLSVRPTVEKDDTINLELEPEVTEFDGFVEYGGPSVALSGDTTATVPPGFYQPIFSVRQIKTEVRVFDGGTLVMGGLTRDEIKTVNDKLPILGDIPGIGRLFRSEGETRQKRNLLIFVTANLVSPGGSLSRQNYPNAKANELFQNPTIITPSGTVNRAVLNQGE